MKTPTPGPGRPKLTRAQRQERARLVAITIRTHPEVAAQFEKLRAARGLTQSATFAELVEGR